MCKDVFLAIDFFSVFFLEGVFFVAIVIELSECF
jgi:hypothetical protein